MNEFPKIFLIGLDGGTFRVIKPAIAEGKLPFLKDLIETGVNGVLTSTLPPATIPAFPTIMTGLNPGKHGIFDFFVKRGRIGRVADSTLIQGSTLWQILSRHNRKSIAINFPLTFPPESINGIIVSGMMTPEGRDFASPKEIMNQLDELTEGYPYKFNTSLFESTPEQFLPKLLEMLNKRQKAARFLIQENEWDLFAILFRASDIISHHRWENQEEVYSIYAKIDEIIGALLAEYPDAYVFIFSDHGFGPYDTNFHINLFLKSLGLLKVKRKTNTTTPTSKRTLRKQIIPKILAHFGIYRSVLRNILPGKFQSILKKRLGHSIRGYIAATNLEVDTERSQAYFSATFTAETQSITINAKTPQEYRVLVNRLKQALSSLVNPITQEKVVKTILHRDEAYHGPFIESAPDLVLLLNEGYKATKTLSGESIFEELPKTQGTHEREGIFLAKGPTVKHQYQIQEIALRDLAPTILHLMNVPIPENIDGVVRKEIFRHDSDPAQREPKFFSSSFEERAKVKLTEQEQEEIKDRLRGLGYID
ncbi:MAG: alkaline phosphatase family protein [Candidatus Hermodarchaeota archaeon]|nr:alkaline phosphatase family protein [Candidatus Hermodarchaeota archaeon]